MLLALAACVNEKFPQEDLMKSEQVTIAAYPAGSSTPSTRVEYNYTADNAPITLSWSDDDAFSVIRGGVNTTFNKSVDEGAGPNDFTGSLPEGEGKYFAVYPTTTVAAHQSVPFDISDQRETLPYLMLASSETGASFHFNHALAYLRVTFLESLENTTATITITTPSGVCTDGNLDLSTGTVSAGSKNTISTTVDFGESTDIMFALPPMAADNKTLTFTVKSGSKTYRATLTGDDTKGIEAGNHYTATVSLTEVLPCLLPDGNTFNQTINAILSSATSIVFVANSSNTSGTLINAGTNSTPAYANVEYVNGERILYIYTSAPEFVFNANCNRMFSSLYGVKTIDFGGCVNTASVTNMSEMFAGTPTSPAYTSLDLSDFNTANVTDMSNMFHTCQNLVSLDVSSFDTRKVINMSKMFNLCRKLVSLDVSNFNTASVTDMSYMFNECEVVASLDVSNFNTASVTNMSHMFYECYAVNSLDVSGFNTAAVEDMSYMFCGCKSVASLDVSKFNTEKVTDMSNMFNGCNAVNSLNVSKFNTENVVNMSYMFNDCKAVNSLDVSKFNTENVANMSYMFYNCNAVSSLDVSNFNTEKVTNMSNMFYGCNAVNSLDVSKFNTANVTNMNSMFWNCKLLTSLNVSSFDTKKVTTMKGMFYGCNALETITFGQNFDTKEVTDMQLMFAYCTKLTSLNLSNFNTEKVTNMYEMFLNCKKLSSLNLSSFNTGKVTNMEEMFMNCNGLESIIFGSNFNTAEVTTMYRMFFGTYALTSLDLSGFNTGKVKNMSNMFNQARTLISLDLCSFTFNATNYSNMFLNCDSLTDVFVKTTADVNKIKGNCGKPAVVKVCPTHSTELS